MKTLEQKLAKALDRMLRATHPSEPFQRPLTSREWVKFRLLADEALNQKRTSRA